MKERDKNVSVVHCLEVFSMNYLIASQEGMEGALPLHKGVVE